MAAADDPLFTPPDWLDRDRLLGHDRTFSMQLDLVLGLGDVLAGQGGVPVGVGDRLPLQPDLLVPAYGIYAGAADGHRAAISIGTNPHYGGAERRVEAHLLDFEGDLYGRRLIVQLWRRLRDEHSFSSEDELVVQIGRDVEQARLAEPPA